MIKIKKCNVCKKEFKPNRKTVVCCSDDCRKIYRKNYYENISFEHTCFICDNMFSSKSKDSKYCSDNCKKIGNFTTKKCKVCSIEFTGRKETLTCSRECQTIMRKNNNLITLNCKNCNKIFKRSRNYISDINSENNFCSSKCNNNFYIYHNIANKKYSENWEETRQKIFNIYGEKCIICSNKNRVEVHHCIPKKFFIKIPRNSDNTEYLIPLCNKCHKHIHRTQDKWFYENFNDIENYLI